MRRLTAGSGGSSQSRIRHASNFDSQRETSRVGVDSRPDSKELDFSRIYVIGYTFKREALHFQAVEKALEWRKLLRGEMRPREAIEFRWDSGSKPQDLMGETYGGLLLVSERFIDTLLEERVTGWGVYPVRLYDKAGFKLSGYHDLAVSGRAGSIDWTKSRIELLPPPVPQGKAMYAEIGMYFEPETWDGSDIFIPEGTSAVCAVDRVKRALQRRKLTNLHFTRLTERRGKLFSEPPGERTGAR